MSVLFSTLFYRQLGILIWKNYVLKMRAIGVLLLELIVPVGLLLAIWGLQKVVTPTNITENIPTAYKFNPDMNNLYSARSCGTTSAVWNCPECSYTSGLGTGNYAPSACQVRHIAVAPESTSNAAAASAAMNFTSWANSYYPGAANYSTFTYFKSEAALLSYIGSADYSVSALIPIMSSAVIFHGAYPSWQYTLRLNQTFSQGLSTGITAPDTSVPYTDIKPKSSDSSPASGDVPYLEQYVSANYFSITDAVNTFITIQTCAQSGHCAAGAKPSFVTAGIAAFPNPSALDAGFWGLIGFSFALVMIIGIMFPLANIIKALVQEKESKIREGMMMMALHGEALWASWIVHFIALFLPLAIILTILGTKVFPYSDSQYVFFYFMLFFLSSIAYCMLVSVFFNNARTASIIGNLLFLAGFFVYIGLSTTKPSRSQLMAACLHPSAAFTFGTLAFIEYEDANIGVTQNTWNVSNQFNITFQDVLTMMVIDTIYLGLLAWYFSNIWPTEFGTHKPWYFLFLPDYWCGCFYQTNKRDAVSVSSIDIELEDPRVEKVPESLLAQKAKKSCVEIKGLVKYFDTNTGRKFAVDGLNLTMYSGQITALLGHNGAGKSTTIAMLTGLFAPDGGSALIEGYDVNTDMEEIRKNLGVCPQHDILFPDLTVQEHLIMFASFKGMRGAQLKEEVEKMIQSVGLTEKRHMPSKTLSGGQKRKLSVGIAFIGGSRVVFLDEPTSGMDPYSRRFTWNVIRQHKEGRVIVLTTHFMDEADLLGDRVAIMGDGKLQCCGSSLFLKGLFGVGYNMVIEKSDPTKFKSNEVQSMVTSRIPTAKVLTDVGAELAFQLPLSSSDRFQGLFDHIDLNQESLGIRSYGMSVTTLEEVFIKVAEGTDNEAQAVAGKQTQGPNYNKVGDVDQAEAQSTSNSVNFTKLKDDDYLQFFFKHMYALVMKRFLYFKRDTRAWIYQFVIPVLFVLAGMVIMVASVPNTYQPPVTFTASMYNTAIATNKLPTPYSAGSNYCVNNYNACSIVAGQPLLMSNISNVASFPAIPRPEINTVGNMSQYLFDHRKDYKASQFGAVSILNYDPAIGAGAFVIHANYTGVHAAPLFAALVADAFLRSIDASTSISISVFPLPATFKQNTILNNYNVDTVVTFILIAISFVAAGLITFVMREREVRAKSQQMVSGVSVFAYWFSTWLSDFIFYQMTLWSIIILICAFPKTELLSQGDALKATIGLFILFGPAMAGFVYLCSFLFKSAAGAQVAMIFVVIILGLVLAIIGIVLRLISETKDIYMSTIRFIFALFPPFAFGDALHSLTLIDSYSYSELSPGQKYSPLDMKIAGTGLVFLGFESVVYVGIAMIIEYLYTIPSMQAYFNITKLPVYDSDALKDDDVLAEEQRIRTGAASENAVILVDDFKKVYPGGKYAVKGVSLAIPNGECFGLLGINGAGKSTMLAMLSGDFPPSAGNATLGGLNLLRDVFKVRRRIGFCPQFDALFDLLTGREHLTLYAHIKGIAGVDVDKVVNGKIAEMGLTEYADRAAGSYSGGNKRKLSVAIAMIGEPSLVFLDEPSTGMDPVARRHMWEIITDIVTKRERCSMILTTHSMEECEALCTRIGIMVGGALRCLGSSQRLKTKYGHGFQMEISLVIPSIEVIDSKIQAILSALGQGGNSEKTQVTMEEITRCLGVISREAWTQRITTTGSGADIAVSLAASKVAEIKQFASFCAMEETFDKLTAFLVQAFGSFVLRERQTAKVRIEVSASLNGVPRKLSKMFGDIEAKKAEVGIQEYSICQTSLEQIFNQFASQQEEEQGPAVGIVG